MSSPTASLSLSSTPSPKIDLKHLAHLSSQKSEVSDCTETALYTILPSSPEELSEDLSNSLNSDFSLASWHYAVNAATGQKKRLLSDTDTPLGISKFQFGNRESFNTSVKDLVQQEPDTPIGGNVTVPVALPIVRLNNAGYIKPPRMEVNAPSGSFRPSKGVSKPVSRCQSKFHDPFRDKYSIKPTGVPGALSSGNEVQVNEICSELSHDGSVETNSKSKAFTSVQGSKLPDRRASPMRTIASGKNEDLVKNVDVKTIPKTEPAPETSDRSTSKANMPANPAPATCHLFDKNETLTSISEVPISTMLIHEATDPLTSAIPVNETNLPVAPEISALATPKLSDGKKGLRHGYRMTRRILMRKKVLQILIGRDLAGPAKESIKKSSKACEVLVPNEAAVVRSG